MPNRRSGGDDCCKLQSCELWRGTNKSELLLLPKFQNVPLLLQFQITTYLAKSEFGDLLIDRPVIHVPILILSSYFNSILIFVYLVQAVFVS